MKESLAALTDFATAVKNVNCKEQLTFFFYCPICYTLTHISSTSRECSCVVPHSSSLSHNSLSPPVNCVFRNVLHLTSLVYCPSSCTIPFYPLLPALSLQPSKCTDYIHTARNSYLKLSFIFSFFCFIVFCPYQIPIFACDSLKHLKLISQVNTTDTVRTVQIK